MNKISKIQLAQANVATEGSKNTVEVQSFSTILTGNLIYRPWLKYVLRSNMTEKLISFEYKD